jgi:hypothetical protein
MKITLLVARLDRSAFSGLLLMGSVRSCVMSKFNDVYDEIVSLNFHDLSILL